MMSVMQAWVFASHWSQLATVMHCFAGTHPAQHWFSTETVSPGPQIGCAILHMTFEWSQSKAVHRPAEHVASTGGVPIAVQVSAKHVGRSHFGTGSLAGSARQLQQSLTSLQSFASVHSGSMAPPLLELDAVAPPPPEPAVPPAPPVPVAPPALAAESLEPPPLDAELDTEDPLTPLLPPVDSTDDAQAMAITTGTERSNEGNAW
jgi:hypothetical protein